MKIYKITLIALLAIFIGACNTATEQKTADGNEANKTVSEKIDETNPTDETKSTDETKDETTSLDDKKDETTSSSATSATPTDTLKTFVEAVKSENEAAIKTTLSDKTIKILDLTAQIKGISFYENLTATDKDGELKELPEIQNEKINGDKATIEVKGKSDKTWNMIPFVKEAGKWKIALFDKQYDKDYENIKKQVEKITTR